MTLTENGRATLLLSVFVALEAVWIDFGRLHRSQNADGILHVLISLQKWTPFYWEQDRFGMLVPLLASGVRHPLANLLFQGWITTTAALLSPFLAARYLLDESNQWFPAGAAANVLLLVFVPPDVQFDWFANQPYGVAIALGCGGLLALDQGSATARVAAAIGIVAAHWVNEGVFFVLVPLVLCAADRRRSLTATLTVLAIGFSLGALMSSLSHAPHTTSVLMPLARWPTGWWELTRGSASMFAGKPALLAALLCSLGTAAVAQATGDGRQTLRAGAACLIVAVVYGLSIGTFEWVRLNLYSPRYVFPSLMFLGLAIGVAAVAPFRKHFRTMVSVYAGLLMLSTAITSGRPSLRRVELDLDQHFGKMTADVISTGARVIGGDYWIVWPAVFHANLTLANQGSSTTVYGLAYRSSATDPLWRNLPAPIFLAAAPHDAAVANRVARAQLSAAFVQRRPTIDLYRITVP
jgi:hypothetical protein